MTFKVATQANENTSQSQGTGSDIDYKAIQDHRVEVCGTQDKHRTIPGFISGFYDLGKQEQKPFETLYNETDPKFESMKKDVEEEKAIVRKGNIYISENGSGQWYNDVEIFSKPRNPKKAIAWCVTFPQIIEDTAPFYGNESNPKPLNVIMGGETWLPRLDESGKKEKAIQDVVYCQENTNNPSGTWGFGTTTTLHKMGSALELLNEHKLLTQSKLGSFLGQPLQFRLKIHNKASNKGGDPWYTEELKFVSEVPEGLPVPEFDESFIHGINFHEANDPETVKALNSRIVNTMKRAVDFEGSVIQKELREAGRLLGENDAPQVSQQGESNQQGGSSNMNGSGSQGNSSSKSETPQQKAPEKVKQESVQQEPVKQGSVSTQTPVYNEPSEIDFDSEIPF